VTCHARGVVFKDGNRDQSGARESEHLTDGAALRRGCRQSRPASRCSRARCRRRCASGNGSRHPERRKIRPISTIRDAPTDTRRCESGIEDQQNERDRCGREDYLASLFKAAWRRFAVQPNILLETKVTINTIKTNTPKCNPYSAGATCASRRLRRRCTRHDAGRVEQYEEESCPDAAGQHGEPPRRASDRVAHASWCRVRILPVPI